MNEIKTNNTIRHIYKFGLAFIKNNKLLLCEPFAFKDLILPGGIIEGNETVSENLKREIREELGDGAALDVGSLQYLDTFEDYAAGRTNVIVEIKLYLGNVFGPIKASSEIKELHWFGISDDWNRLSRIIKNKILPYLIKNKLIKEK